MAKRDDLQDWVIAALKYHGGSASIVQAAQYIWAHHEQNLRASGDLLRRVESVRQSRLASKAASTRNLQSTRLYSDKSLNLIVITWPFLRFLRRNEHIFQWHFFPATSFAAIGFSLFLTRSRFISEF